MKIHSLWFVALVIALCGCADEGPLITYDQPLISPGGEFSRLPPAVQNSVRAEAGMAQIVDISEGGSAGARIYEVRFRNDEIFPPLYVASDGSVLNSDLTVAVRASRETIEASTASGVGAVKLEDLPAEVVRTIRHSAPTAEVDAITRLTSEEDVFYDITFKDPAHHHGLLIRDNGRLME